MSLLTAVILPMLEQELGGLEPLAARALISVIKMVGQHVVDWAEEKLNVDIDGDGKIGGE